LGKARATALCVVAGALAWGYVLWAFLPPLDPEALLRLGVGRSALRWVLMAWEVVPPLLAYTAGCALLVFVARSARSKLTWLPVGLALLAVVIALASVGRFVLPAGAPADVAYWVWLLGLWPPALLLTIAAVFIGRSGYRTSAST